jgi:hypothetical protein
MMKVNLSKVKEATGSEPLPMGKYHVSIIKSEPIIGELKQDGSEKKPYVKTWFKVLSGPCAGRYAFKNFTMTEAAMPFVKPFLLAIGYPASEEIEILPEQWLNVQLVIQIGINGKDLNGQVRHEPIAYYSLESQKLQPIEDIGEKPY